MLCPAGTYQDEEGQMFCEVCPGPEGREVSKVVGARNMSECGGENLVKDTSLSVQLSGGTRLGNVLTGREKQVFLLCVLS